MNKKIKVLVVPSDKFGVGFYRSVNPHSYLDKLYGDEFDVEINNDKPTSYKDIIFNRNELQYVHHEVKELEKKYQK